MLTQKRKAYAFLPSNLQTSFLLVREQNDAWALPGVDVPPHYESDEIALKRMMINSLHTQVQVSDRVGQDRMHDGGATVLIRCRYKYKHEDIQTPKKEHKYFTPAEVSHLKINGDPEDRLGIMGRMVWDCISLIKMPAPQPSIRITYGYELIKDGTVLVHADGQSERQYPRLDPFSPTGLMQPTT